MYSEEQATEMLDVFETCLTKCQVKARSMGPGGEGMLDILKNCGRYYFVSQKVS